MTIKEMTKSENKWLRHQVGVLETRPSVFITYPKRKPPRLVTSDQHVSVFRLLGFGETLKAAMKMAGVKDIPNETSG